MKQSSDMEQNRKLTALQTAANSGIFQLSEELGIKVVASNDVHFVSRADGIAQDVMLAIQHGKKVSDPNRIRYSHMEYLKAEEEMRCLFPDHPEVIDNTNCILDKVERYSIWEEVKLPKLSDNPNADLRDQVYKGMILRHLEDNQRIEEELKYIEDKGIVDFFSDNQGSGGLGALKRMGRRPRTWQQFRESGELLPWHQQHQPFGVQSAF